MDSLQIEKSVNLSRENHPFSQRSFVSSYLLKMETENLFLFIDFVIQNWMEIELKGRSIHFKDILENDRQNSKR